MQVAAPVALRLFHFWSALQRLLLPFSCHEQQDVLAIVTLALLALESSSEMGAEIVPKANKLQRELPRRDFFIPEV